MSCCARAAALLIATLLGGCAGSGTARAAARSWPGMQVRQAADSPAANVALARLDRLLRSGGDEVGGTVGNWNLSRGGVPIYVIADAGRDRIRIISPVTKIADVEIQEVYACMSANFARARDARYCINDDILWAAFSHPLSSLGDELCRSALDQVVALRDNFRQSYGSGSPTD